MVCMCYWENLVENIEEKKNAFTKKMDKVGELTDRKRVMVFADDDNAIDTKTHFEYITHKIDLSAEGLIKAVEEAIAMKIEATEGKATTNKSTKKTTKKPPVVEEEHDEEEDELMEKLKAVVAQTEEDPEIRAMEEQIDAEGDVPFDIDESEDIFEEEADEDTVVTLDDTRLNAIRDKFRGSTAQDKSEVKKHLASYGGKLVAEMKQSDVNAIEEILGLNDEV